MTTTAMNGSLRFNLTSELKDSDKPKPFRRVDEYQHGKVYQGILSFDKGIPSYIAKQATDLLAVSNLLDHVDLSKLSILELPATTTRALVVPVPGISRFTMPEPFRGKQTITCALLHGTSLTAAQNILIEGFIRPANWTYHKNPLKCDVPTFGAFHLGREIGSGQRFPEWAQRELMDSAQKKGKGQQKVLFGALYRGADHHTSFKAGGNEMAQVQVAQVGIVTTSEKYTIAHSKHVGLQFFALRWQNLPLEYEDDVSSDDVTYLGRRRRSAAREDTPPDGADPPAPTNP